MQAMERRLKAHGVGAAYEDATIKRFNRAATALTAGGALLLATAGRRSRAAAVAGGVLVNAGALAERWTIFKAGSVSARRREDTIDPQRRRLDGGAAR